MTRNTHANKKATRSNPLQVAIYKGFTKKEPETPFNQLRGHGRKILHLHASSDST